MVYIRTFYLQANASIKPQANMSKVIFGDFQAQAVSVSEKPARFRLINFWQSRYGCLVSQLDVPVDRHSRLTADARLDDIDFVARLQEFPGLLFDRL